MTPQRSDGVVIASALVVDDHPLIHEGFRHLLAGLGAREVAAEATALAAFRAYRRRRPDLMIVDMNLASDPMAGASLIRRIRKVDGALPILGLSAYPQRDVAMLAERAGADGFVDKSGSATDLLAMIRSVVERSRCEPPGRRGPRPHEPAGFSAREVRTLDLLGKGRNYKQIAADLGVSYKTVAETGALLKFKLKAGTMQELVRAAVMMLFVG